MFISSPQSNYALNFKILFDTLRKAIDVNINFTDLAKAYHYNNVHQPYIEYSGTF